MMLMPLAALYTAAWTAGGMMATAQDVARWTRSLFRGDVLSPAMQA